MQTLNRGAGRVTAFVVAVAASALLCAMWTGIASAAGAGPGSIEICKAPDNGAAGQSFSFTATLGTSTLNATVTGGSCSAPMSAKAGSWVILEDLSSGLWTMTADSVVPSANWVSDNVKVGKVKINVVSGQETQVTVTNAPALATIKVCKWSSSPALQGAQYSFTIGSSPVTAVAGKNQANAGCSTALPTQPGTKIKITEAVPSGETVASTAVSANTTLKSWTGGVVNVVTGVGANVVYYEDEPVGPPQTGYLEICKDAGDAFISTTVPFNFTITDHAGFTTSVPVLAGQCSGPIQVAAGNVSVVEAPTAGTQVTSITLGPLNNGGTLGPTNINNGTATVVVPVSSDTSVEAQVLYTNSTLLTTIKVCKYLAAGSDALAGKTFTFTVVDAAGTQTVTIVATTNANGACKNVPVQVPTGSTISVTETGTPNVSADGGAIGAGETKVVASAVQGPNIFSFTNQAFGTIEICKNMIATDTAYNGTVFQFKVDGLPQFGVAAGRCSGPLSVPAGNVVVNELALANFAFVSSSATGPTGDNRVVSGTNPVTVSVPFGGVSNETLVTYTNRVLRSSFKICKLIDPGSTTPLSGLSFQFDWQTLVNGVLSPISTVSVSPPYPGPDACTGLLGNIPVVNADGTPTMVGVGEIANPAVYRAGSVTVQNGTITFGPADIAPYTGLVNFAPGAGVVIVTYTNRTP